MRQPRCIFGFRNMIIDLDGIKIEVTRKKVKNLRLVVSYSDGKVRVSAPMRVSDKVIYDFVESKRSWLKKHLSGDKMHSVPTKNTEKSRDTLMMWGKSYNICILQGNKDRAFFEGDEIKAELRDTSDRDALEAALSALQRAELREAIGESFPLWEARLGLHATEVKIRDMKTRWGSCSVDTGRIRINLKLAELPRVCLEYVILHELAHLRYPDHGAEFKEILGRHMPDWQSVRESMKKS